MQSGRSTGGSACRGKSRQRSHASSFGVPAHAAVEPRAAAVGSRARRQARAQGSRELALDALRTEVSALRAQLTESLVREAQARTLARTDALTKLSNRSGLIEQLRQALSGDDPQPGRLAVLFVDLDGFKAINDLHGHRIGDEVLRLVGERLAAGMRATDIVARLGGDEFVCLVRQPGSRARVAQIAGKLFDALSDPYRIGSLCLHAPASIGIAISPEDGTRAETLLERADAAMYRAKRQRTGCEFLPSCDAPATATMDDALWFIGAEGWIPA